MALRTARGRRTKTEVQQEFEKLAEAAEGEKSAIVEKAAGMSVLLATVNACGATP